MNKGIPSKFVWTKMDVHAGEPLGNIIRRKKLECEASEGEFAGTFWWGVGEPKGPAIWIHLAEHDPEILFSKMLSRPKPEDSNPDKCFVWTTYHVSNKGGYGRKQLSVPKNVIVVSGPIKKNNCYALVCSNLRLCEPSKVSPLYVTNMTNLNKDGNYGKTPGSSQTTSVVKYSQRAKAIGERYPVEMRAKLARPYFVKLGTPIPLDDSQLQLLKAIGNRGKMIDDYRDVARKIRG